MALIFRIGKRKFKFPGYMMRKEGLKSLVLRRYYEGRGAEE